MAPVRVLPPWPAPCRLTSGGGPIRPFDVNRVLITIFARHWQTRTLFPVYVDPPTYAASSPLTAACSKLSLQTSPSRPRRAAALGNARAKAPTRILLDKAMPAKENEPLRLATPSALGLKSKKPATGLGIGRKVAREALRDVSQEFECPGIEPEGFRKIVRQHHHHLNLRLGHADQKCYSPYLQTPPPIVLTSGPAKKGPDIFVDPSSGDAAATAAQPTSKPTPLGPARPRTLTVYTSPPRKMTVVQPSSITGTVKRGRGLGGAPGLGGSVGRGLRA